MHFMTIVAVFLLAGQAVPPRPQPAAQPQRRSVGSATLAIAVADPAGTPLADVRVTLTGPLSRDARTERGRIAFENLPAGTYRLRFDRDGFVSLERDVVARAGVPIDVKVTLTPAPAPPPAPTAPVAPMPSKPPAAALTTDPVSIDMPAFIEKNYVGRGAGKVSPLACTTGGPANLMQVKEPIAEHTHADADEFLYTVAGEGTVKAGGRDQAMRAGVLMMVPRGVAHTIQTARGPLVLISIRAGERCTPQ